MYQINVSNAAKVDSEQTRFQSPRSGKFVSDEAEKALKDAGIKTFQSPRSGKFVSDIVNGTINFFVGSGFNPLDRGNLYQI